MQTMDYGRPMKPFGLGQTIWADTFWGILVIFGQFISTHFGTVSPLSMFSILVNHYFYKKLSLCIHIENFNFGLGFEFGPQRTRDSAFVCTGREATGNPQKALMGGFLEKLSKRLEFSIKSAMSYCSENINFMGITQVGFN